MPLGGETTLNAPLLNLPSRYRGVAFIAGLLYAVEYVFRLHLGIPHKKVIESILKSSPL